MTKPRNLPVEIWDMIFLNLDYETLRKTRKLQSDYVKKATKFNVMNDAAKEGNYENMIWLKKNGCKYDTFDFSYAAKVGGLKVIKILKENDFPWDGWVSWFAAKKCDIETLTWLKENGCPIFYYDATRFAIEKNNVEMLRWIHENGHKFHRNRFIEAVQKGNIKVLNFFKEIDCSYHYSLMEHYAGKNCEPKKKSKIQKWVKENLDMNRKDESD